MEVDQVHQTAFDEMKHVITRETLMTYPNFNKPFDIHTDASLYQLSACISHNSRPIVFLYTEVKPGSDQVYHN